MSGIEITKIDVIPVCSPAWLDAHPIHGPSDIADQSLIMLKGNFKGWRLWGGAHSLDLPTGAEVLSFDNYASAMSAVQRGLGMGLGLLPLVQPWIDDGRIVVPLDLPVPVPESLYLVFVPGGQREEQLQVLGQRFHQLLTTEA